MIIEEPVVELDERTTHNTRSAFLPEGFVENHLDHETQKRIAVQNLNQTKFLISPDGTHAISAEEIKSPHHREILEASIKTLLGERLDNEPYLAPSEGVLGLGGNNFAQIPAPANIKALAVAGVKDFADALNISLSTHVARVR